MSKNSILADKKEILHFMELVGGSENILKIYNCISRLRVKVRNLEVVNLEEIKQINKVTNAFVNGEEIHIVFEKSYNTKFFKKFQKQTGFDDGVFELTQVVAEKKNILDKMVEVFSGVAMPLLFILGAYGILSMIQSLITTEWVQGKKESSLSYSVGFFEQVAALLTILTTGMSLALTMGIPWAIFKYTKQNQVMGLTLGLVFVLSTKVGTIGIADLNQLNYVEGWANLNVFDKLYYTWFYSEAGGNLLANGMHSQSYTMNWFGGGSFAYKLSFDGNMIGIILSSIVGVNVMKYSQKIFKNEIAAGMLLAPFVFFVTFLIAFIVVGPITFIITDYISMGLTKGFANQYLKWLIWGVVGIAGPYILLFSLDGFILLIGFLQFYTPDKLGNANGPIVVVIIYMCLTTSITTATLTFIFQNRNVEELRHSALNFALIGYISGVATPMLYKVNSKVPHTMYASCVGGFVAALICCAAGLTGTWGTGSMMGILSIQGSSTMDGVTTWGPNGMLWGLIACLASILVTSLLTYGLSKINYFKLKTEEAIKKEWILVK